MRIDSAGDDARARGPLRPGGHRPAGLADRPVQPALLLLHAAPRDSSGCPTTTVLTDDEVVRLIGIGVRAARRPRGALHRRRAAGAPRPGRHRPRRIARLGPDLEISLTTNALGLSRTAGTLKRGRARPGQRQPRHACAPRRSREITRRDRLDDVLAGRRPRRAAPGSARSRSTRCCCAGSTTTRRPSCCAGRSPRATSCGSSSRCRSTPSTTGARTEMIIAEEILDAPRGGVRAVTGQRAPGERPRRALPGRRRPGDGRRDRVGDPALLRRLRPGAAHRRRTGPQLPVRPRGVRPADGAARRAPPTRRSPTGGWSRCAASARATASTTRRSCSPTGRCPRSAADSPAGAGAQRCRTTTGGVVRHLTRDPDGGDRARSSILARSRGQDNDPSRVPPCESGPPRFRRSSATPGSRWVLGGPADRVGGDDGDVGEQHRSGHQQPEQPVGAERHGDHRRSHDAQGSHGHRDQVATLPPGGVLVATGRPPW